MGVDFDKIKRLRVQQDLTQEQAAAKAKFKSRQAWNNVESGRRDPTIATLEAMAKALGVKVQDLLK